MIYRMPKKKKGKKVKLTGLTGRHMYSGPRRKVLWGKKAIGKTETLSARLRTGAPRNIMPNSGVEVKKKQKGKKKRVGRKKGLKNKKRVGFAYEEANTKEDIRRDIDTASRTKKLTNKQAIRNTPELRNLIASFVPQDKDRRGSTGKVMKKFIGGAGNRLGTRAHGTGKQKRRWTAKHKGGILLQYRMSAPEYGTPYKVWVKGAYPWEDRYGTSTDVGIGEGVDDPARKGSRTGRLKWSPGMYSDDKRY